MTALQVQNALVAMADKTRVPDYQRFFKTAPGEYGEGDVFIGVKVPLQRQVAKQYKNLPLSEVKVLLIARCTSID